MNKNTFLGKNYDNSRKLLKINNLATLQNLKTEHLDQHWIDPIRLLVMKKNSFIEQKKSSSISQIHVEKIPENSWKQSIRNDMPRVFKSHLGGPDRTSTYSEKKNDNKTNK